MARKKTLTNINMDEFHKHNAEGKITNYIIPSIQYSKTDKTNLCHQRL